MLAIFILVTCFFLSICYSACIISGRCSRLEEEMYIERKYVR